MSLKAPRARNSALPADEEGESQTEAETEGETEAEAEPVREADVSVKGDVISDTVLVLATVLFPALITPDWADTCTARPDISTFIERSAEAVRLWDMGEATAARTTVGESGNNEPAFELEPEALGNQLVQPVSPTS